MYTIEEFDKQKAKIMNYIMYKKRTKQEVIHKFINTLPKELLDDIIVYIEEAGYLNDKDYIQRAVKEFIALKNLSIKEISYKLASKGINKNLIEDYLYEHREELEDYELQSAKRILMKKTDTLNQEEMQNYFYKKGYQSETIKLAMKEEK